eukprot:4312087-Amphidinium_carterae.2
MLRWEQRQNNKISTTTCNAQNRSATLRSREQGTQVRMPKACSVLGRIYTRWAAKLLRIFKKLFREPK